MQELDKLEKRMDSEACAAILDKIDGPKTKARKPSRYTFTIKVIEAEDLKACDTSGYSDPYVVFGDEYQKRLHKTRIVSRNLNPRWDESFDVMVQGPVNVIATIWDYDTFGDHDYVGRTSLKLDPVHFGDYLPREFWLDLDSQGRLLIRVSMEGERDDIEFHFGKSFRHLKRTERDMVRKITDKVSKQTRWVGFFWGGVRERLERSGFLLRCCRFSCSFSPVFFLSPPFSHLLLPPSTPPGDEAYKRMAEWWTDLCNFAGLLQ